MASARCSHSAVPPSPSTRSSRASPPRCAPSERSCSSTNATASAPPAAVAAALWLGQALGGPVIGRLADRRGHRPVLLVACGANAAVLFALVAAVLGGLPLAARMALAVAAGLTVPQVGPLARARWARLASEDKRLLGAALSFDATLDEVGFMVGPALMRHPGRDGAPRLGAAPHAAR